MARLSEADKERLRRFGGKGKRFVKRTATTTGEIAGKLERARQAGVSLTGPGFQAATGVRARKQDIRKVRGPQPFISKAFGLRDETEGTNLRRALDMNAAGNGTTLQRALRGKKRRDDPFLF